MFAAPAPPGIPDDLGVDVDGPDVAAAATDPDARDKDGAAQALEDASAPFTASLAMVRVQGVVLMSQVPVSAVRVADPALLSDLREAVAETLRYVEAIYIALLSS
jgi:hypothetical protein